MFENEAEILLAVKDWLSQQADDKLIQNVIKKIASETKQRLIKNPHSTVDYGYSFPGLNEVRQSCLKEVRAFYTKKKERPYVADIGAGFGNMTWKLLAAGAKVDAIELQRPTAEELSKRLKSMDAIFWEDISIDNLLTVFPQDVFSFFQNAPLNHKYDFIWLGNVLHFLTPHEIKKLTTIFQRFLQPDGKIFAEFNSLSSFCHVPNYSIILTHYERAKTKGLEIPGFLVANSFTIIDCSTSQVVKMSYVSALDIDDMKQYSIPIQIQAYEKGYLGPANEAASIESNLLAACSPHNRYKIHRFHQIMTFLDESDAKTLFFKAGFNSIIYNVGVDGHHVLSSSHKNPSYVAMVLQRSNGCILQMKQLTDSSNSNDFSYITFSLGNPSAHDKLLSEAEKLCRNNKETASYLKAIQERDYSLALRKACAAGSLPLVKAVLKYKSSLNIDINKPSPSNGWTALDWIENNKKLQTSIKEEILKLMKYHDAHSGTSNSGARKKNSPKERVPV